LKLINHSVEENRSHTLLHTHHLLYVIHEKIVSKQKSTLTYD